jgi:hypothetical protein
VPLPQEILDQAISCAKYEAKPATAPTKAMPPLAANDPVKRNPISIIEKNPAICQVTALVKSLIVLSIAGSSKCIEFPLNYPRYGCIDIM